MRHTREKVIKRIIQEFERLDCLVSNLTDENWNRLLTRPETKDPWTVKDALAHITHWKADKVRKIVSTHTPSGSGREGRPNRDWMAAKAWIPFSSAVSITVARAA
jgi:hypothetical protein